MLCETGFRQNERWHFPKGTVVFLKGGRIVSFLTVESLLAEKAIKVGRNRQKGGRLQAILPGKHS